MNIFKFEFKKNINSTLIWSISISFAIFSFMAIYPSFAKEAELMNEIMSNFPEEFLQAFGMANMNFSNILGFLGFSFSFIYICLGIQAANYGFSLVSVEERELTADFLLAKPIKRSKILTSKFLAAILCLLITNAFLWISSFSFINLFKGDKTFDANALATVLIGSLFFQLFFLCLPVLISLWLKKIRSVLSFSMGLVFGLYILSAFSGVINDETLSYFTPFKHFDPVYIINNGSFDTPKIYISIIIIIISIIASYTLYQKRNIHSI